MFPPLRSLLLRVVRSGNLTVIDANCETHCFGDGTGSKVAIRIANRSTEQKLAFDPELAAGEAYMTGDLVIVEGTFYDLVATVMSNIRNTPMPGVARGLERLRSAARRIAQYNPADRARRNVAHHYDIDPRIYDLFLDTDRQYSCAYFRGGEDLDTAQANKKRHIAAKLAIEPQHRVLDIGSGWGGLALYLAEAAQCDVTGITLSEQQLRIARGRISSARSRAAIEFRLQDYRTINDRFDRIVSVGMFEHVGINHYGTFFERLSNILADDGVALVHTIGRSGPPAPTNPFVAKYIFPGGALPSLSEITEAVERAGLIVTDVEVLRLHYAETLRQWRTRFLARRDEAVAIAGEEFTRMWEAYLAGSEAAFRYQDLVVFQIQLTHRIDVLPMTRDYIVAREHALEARDREADVPDALNLAHLEHTGNSRDKPAL